MEDVVQGPTGREGGLGRPSALPRGAKRHAGALIAEEPTQPGPRSAQEGLKPERKLRRPTNTDQGLSNQDQQQRQ